VLVAGEEPDEGLGTWRRRVAAAGRERARGVKKKKKNGCGRQAQQVVSAQAAERPRTGLLIVI
jgi:hypothetical protein